MSLFKISFCVLSLHAALIVWGAYHIPSLPVVKQARLVTQTIAFHDASKERNPISKAPVVASSDSPAVKKKEKPKPVEKVEKPKPKPAPKPVESEKKIIKDQSLIAKAKENIAKITKTSDKTTKDKPVASVESKSAISKEPESALLTAYELDYRDELAGRLKLILRLPEYGMVNVRLTVDRRGKVKRIEVVAAESEINKKYIESELPQLVFPAFGSNFGGESEHTFLISLNNEM